MLVFQSMLATILLAALLHAEPSAQPIAPPEQVHEIIINNRILTKVNGKNISVLDVVKKMDVFLNRNYPQYTNSKTMRFQFYTNQWKNTLQQIIDSELMVADAESREVKVTDGEVREEVQSRFGPNVMSSLDKLGLSYEEARKMVHQDMIVQRIQWVRVTSKALQKVGSQEVKKAYEEYLQENPPKEDWNFQFITIRSDDLEQSRQLGLKISDMKQQAEDSLSAAADLLKAELPPDSTATLSLSQEFTTEDKSLAEAHREILTKLQVGMWSAPTIQKSRDGSSVVRIFHLKNHTKTKPPAFSILANELKNSLLNRTVDAEMGSYRAKLYKRFNFDQNALDIPQHFEPFTAR